LDGEANIAEAWGGSKPGCGVRWLAKKCARGGWPPRARVERSNCSSVGGGADLDGVGGIRTVDSQPVTRGRAGSLGNPGASAGIRALARHERYYLRTPRSLLHGQP
jgi:hypothetical protein